MVKLEVMRFDWLRNAQPNFWELIRNKQDDLQYVILDKAADRVLFTAGIEPTSLGGGYQGTRSKCFGKEAQLEEEVCEVTVSSSEQLHAFLKSNCSFTTIKILLPTAKYGEDVVGESAPINDKQLHADLVKEDFSEKFGASPTHIQYATQCIYESGSHCIYQHYYIVQVDALNLEPDVVMEPVPRAAVTMATRARDSTLGKLCESGVLVGVKREDISTFTLNKTGFLVSPGLMACLQYVLRRC